jgi:pimeloyl-ACP methyl ester carboxylesterase
MNAVREVLLYLPGIDGTGRLLFAQPRLRSEFHVINLAYPQDCHHTYDDLVMLSAERLTPFNGVTVLAESFGGAVGMLLALQFPNRVKRLMLINTFAWYPRRLFIDIAALVGRFFPDRPADPMWQPWRRHFIFDKEVPLEHLQEWWKQTADVPLAAMGHRCELVSRLDLRARLSHLKTPTWVLAAPNDRIVPAVAGRFLARHIPACRIWQPPLGHAALVHPHLDVANWLKGEMNGSGTF